MAEGQEQPKVAGLVLAAGRSTRMGEPKPLLEIGGRSFLQATLDTLGEGGCASRVAVIASPDAAFAARSAGAAIAQGKPEQEQIDSLRSGLDTLGDDVDAVVVLPVDHPRVRASTVAAIIGAWRDEPDAVVRPVYGDTPGHPTLFPRRVWGTLLDADLPDGARSVVETERVVDVPVDDPGVVTDIDTPEDLEAVDG